MSDAQIRRHSGWEIRNAEGLYWHDKDGWVPVGMRWCGHSRRDMRQLARDVGGTLVRLTLVRRSKVGRTAVRCPECFDTRQMRDRLAKLERVAAAAARLVVMRVAGCLCCDPEACADCPLCPKCETAQALSAAG